MVEDPPFLLEISKLSQKPSEEDNAVGTVTVVVNGTTDEGEIESMDRDQEEVDERSEELREARIRAAQMEKTVQWWSECTANWREKWGTVKNERNKAREDIKVLKAKLEAVNQEMYKLRRERNEFSEGNSKLRKDVERMEAELRRDRRAFVPPLRVVGDSSRNESETIPVKTTAISELSKSEEQKIAENYFGDTAVKTVGEDKLIEAAGDNESIKNKRQILESELSSEQGSLNEDKEGAQNACQTCAEVREELTVLEEKLENAEKAVLEEKSSKESLSDTVDELTADIEQLKGTIQEEQLAKDKAISELKSFKEEKSKRLTRSTSESWVKNGEDRKIKELREEIAKLQKENTAEWNKQEKLETEKLAALRESKKLRHEVEDLTKELQNKISETTKAAEFDIKQLKKELEEKKQELADLKVSHFKLRKVYQDKKEDVLHTTTKAEQQEDDIKRLRTRIDELKKQLILTEDEVDHKDNLARKLERSLEEQTQQCHVLQVQLEHLQSRWKQMTLTARLPRRDNDSSELSEEERRFFESDEDF